MDCTLRLKQNVINQLKELSRNEFEKGFAQLYRNVGGKCFVAEGEYFEENR